jgi:hypothetical protein
VDDVRNRMAGIIVAFVGVPGAGKSTLCDALARITGAVPLKEPTDWPPAVTDPGSANGFTALTWFRAMRVPLYYQAMRERDLGRFAILDTYYDKICHYLLGAEGMDWFLSPSDPYFDLYEEIARRDWISLPAADVVVLIYLEEATWRHHIAQRNRALDHDWDVSANFLIQRHFVEAAEKLRDIIGIPLVHFEQDLSSPDDSAVRLLFTLQRAGFHE